jgi:hypothetical protein
MSRDQGAGDHFRSEGSRSVDLESTFHLIERARVAKRGSFLDLAHRRLTICKTPTTGDPDN